MLFSLVGGGVSGQWRAAKRGVVLVGVINDYSWLVSTARTAAPTTK